nr:MAG TPA: hypothetical protein [Caudoviricetes sp.]
MMSYFVCLRLDGKKIPSLHDSYPDLFEEKR